jgi:hypothetical protein
MYSFQTKSVWKIFIPRRIKARVYIYLYIYIYSSQLSSFGTNRQAKEGVAIRDFRMRYMLWPGIKYPMNSFPSNSDWIIFNPRRVKARLYI